MISEPFEAALSWGVLRGSCWRAIPTKNRPVLFLHGWLDNAASFNLLIPELDLAPVYAIDLAGHGHSDHRPSGIYYVWDYARDLVELITKQGWDQVHLVGHSLGGAVASLLAALFPDRVASLSLIESSGPLALSQAEENCELMRHAFSNSRMQPDGRLRPETSSSSETEPSTESSYKAKARSFEQLVRLRMHGRFEVSQIAAKQLVQRGTHSAGEGGGLVWRHDARLTQPSPIRLMESQVRAFLSQLTMPVLHIGANHGLESASDVERLNCIKQLKRIVVVGNHHPHLGDARHEIAIQLQKFIRAHD